MNIMQTTEQRIYHLRNKIQFIKEENPPVVFHNIENLERELELLLEIKEGE